MPKRFKNSHFRNPLQGLSFGALWCALVCGVVVLTSAKIEAQINTSTLNGSVVDAGGASVPEAEITAHNQDTGATRTTKTSGSGEFSLPSLAPGKYDVTITKTGFSSLRQTGISLEVAQVANLALTLQVGSTGQSIVVEANAQGIETSNATLGTVIPEREVVDLPLNGRQFTQLLELAPGVVPIDQSQNNGKQGNFGAGAPSPSVNGAGNRSNLYFIDGIFASNPFFSGFALSPSIDAIQEFKSQTHSDLAEYGQATGAIISVVSKSGTNSFHGSAFEFFRNGKLDARNTFSQTKLPYHQNQFGGTFGGPIIKNKLFFFANYEGGRQVQPQPAYYTVPTLQQRMGNFSGLPQTIYDPATYNPITQKESAFPGNIIPSSRIDSKMVTFLNGNYPLPNTSLGAYNFVSNTGNRAVQDQGNVRVDYNLGSKDILFGRYTRNESTNAQPSALGNVFTTGFNGYNVGMNYIHTFGATTVMQVTFAVSSLNIPQMITEPVDQGAVFSAAGLGAGFNQFPGGTAGPQLPADNLNAAPGLQGYAGYWNGAGPIGPMNTGQLSGSVSKVTGDHTIKFGGSLYKTWMYTNWNGNSETFSYLATANAACQYAASNPTAAANCPGGASSAASTGGDPVASQLLSLPVAANRNLGNSGVNLRFTTPSLFVQDSWRPTRKLTLNYGLRWDYSAPVTEKYNRLPTYNIYSHQYLVPTGDADAPSTLPANVSYSGRNSITTKHWKDFSPRLGVAYQLFPKTVIRVAVGRTFNSWADSLQIAQQNRGGWPSGLSQNASTQNLNAQGLSVKPDGTPYTGENPFFGPATIPASPLPAGGLGFQDVRWQPSSQTHWNAEVQQDLGVAGALSVAYVGSQSEHLPMSNPYNLAPASTSPIHVYPDTVYGGTGTVLDSIGTASYESIQLQLNRRFANGFGYLAAYTWSQSRSQAVCGDNANCVQNIYNIAADQGPTSLDVPNIFTFSGIYRLPFGKKQRYVSSGMASKIVGDWQTNAIFVARSGLVFNPCCVGDPANAGGGSQRYNISGNPYGAKTVAQYFNPSAFVIPAVGTYATSGFNSLRGPGYWNLDFSLFRDFQFTEHTKLQFRSEFFNIFNHPNYSNPGCYNCSISSTTGQGNRDIQLALKLLF